MMTMKQACEYLTNSRKERNRSHQIEVTNGNYCSGLTNKEYNRMHIKGKGAGSKGRTYSHTKLWKSQEYSNNIHTMYNDNTFKTI
jgi:hypothetical protein